MTVYHFEDQRYTESDISRMSYEDCEIMEARLTRELDELDNTIFQRQIDFKAGKAGFPADEFKELKQELADLRAFKNSVFLQRKLIKKSRLERFQECARVLLSRSAYEAIERAAE